MSKETEDVEVQAGGLGMSLPEMVQRYLKTPGHLLAVVRFFAEKNEEDVAKAAGISIDTLRAYEHGQRKPTMKDLPQLAKALGADLRSLLEAFGYAEPAKGEVSMGLAAQFDGEVSEQEKADLKALVSAFAKKRSGM
jgi:transcriptional regulator with XRE-family HTH domain